MTIRLRLVFTLTAIAGLVAIPAVYGLSRLTALRDIAYELQGRHAVAWVALGGLEGALRELDRQQRSYLAAPDSASRTAMWRSLGQAAAQRDRLEEAGYGEETRATADALRRLEERTGELERVMEARGVGAATDLFFAEVGPAADAVRTYLEEVAAAIDGRSAVATARARQISVSATTWVLAALVFALALVLLLGSLLTGALVRPLRRLQRAMASVAEGRLDTPSDLSYSRRDELGELNRSFRSMTEQLGELTRQRAEFVSIVTHDLKTPLNVVAGYAEMLREGLYEELPPDHRTALDAISEQIQALLEQIQHLLDLSRLEAGAFRLVFEEIYLTDLCTGLKRGFETLAKQRLIHFSVDLDPAAPEKIVGDMDRLRNEVLGNLLGNAFKFTEPGRRIAVGILGEGDKAVIEVSDTGVGIPAEELPHIFDRYFQGRQGTRTSGAGLGLAIAREVVGAHGGEIQARSQPGEGTSFRVRLPIAPSPDEGQPVPSDEADPDGSSGEADREPTPTKPPPVEAVPLSSG